MKGSEVVWGALSVDVRQSGPGSPGYRTVRVYEMMSTDKLMVALLAGLHWGVEAWRPLEKGRQAPQEHQG